MNEEKIEAVLEAISDEILHPVQWDDSRHLDLVLHRGEWVIQTKNGGIAYDMALDQYKPIPCDLAGVWLFEVPTRFLT